MINNNSIKNTLIRNYFEVNGSFDGIYNSRLANYVSDCSEDYLYSCLGYSNKVLSPKDYCRVRYLNQINDTEALSEVLGCDTSTLKDRVQSIGLPDSIKVDTIVLTSSEVELVKVISAYLNSSSGTSFDGFTFKDYIDEIKKITTTKLLKELFSNEIYKDFINSLMLTSVVKPDLAGPVIEFGVLYYNKKLTKPVIKRLIDYSISYIVTGSFITLQTRNKILNILNDNLDTIFRLNQDRYLTLLDISMNLKVSLKTLLASFDYKIPDKISVYETVNALVEFDSTREIVLDTVKEDAEENEENSYMNIFRVETDSMADGDYILVNSDSLKYLSRKGYFKTIHRSQKSKHIFLDNNNLLPLSRMCKEEFISEDLYIM